MTKDDIIRMAREAGYIKTVQGGAEVSMASMECLERFAALVADAEAKRIHDEGMVTVGHMREQIAAEREACAKTCDQLARKNDAEHHLFSNTIDKGVRLAKAVGLAEGAEAIRARGQA